MNRALQTGINDCLARLPEESRLAVRTIELVPGSEVGSALLEIRADSVVRGVMCYLCNIS